MPVDAVTPIDRARLNVLSQMLLICDRAERDGLRRHMWGGSYLGDAMIKIPGSDLEKRATFSGTGEHRAFRELAWDVSVKLLLCDADPAAFKFAKILREVLRQVPEGVAMMN